MFKLLRYDTTGEGLRAFFGHDPTRDDGRYEGVMTMFEARPGWWMVTRAGWLQESVKATVEKNTHGYGKTMEAGVPRMI